MQIFQDIDDPVALNQFKIVADELASLKARIKELEKCLTPIKS